MDKYNYGLCVKEISPELGSERISVVYANNSYLTLISNIRYNRRSLQKHTGLLDQFHICGRH